MKLNRYCALGLSALLGLLPMSALAVDIQLEEGAPVSLKLMDALSSGRNEEGNRIAFTVQSDVLAADGKTVAIRAGLPAWGMISQIQERGMIGQKGQMALNLEGVKTVDAQRVLLRGSINREGRSRMGTVIALSLLISPLFLLMKGKDATLPAGTIVTGYVERGVTIHVPDATAATTASAPTSPTFTAPAEGALPDYLGKYAEKTQSAHKESGKP